MQLKAFTLIELSVVILLLGIIFSLVLSSYKKNISDEISSIKDIPNFIKNRHYKDGIFYIYGKDCQKSLYIDEDGNKKELKKPNFPKETQIFIKDINEKFENIRFEDIDIDKKIERVCLKIEFKNANFIDKLILSSQNFYYLFSPFWQNVMEFKNLDKAKKSYTNEEFLPYSIDGYYHGE